MRSMQNLYYRTKRFAMRFLNTFTSTKLVQIIAVISVVVALLDSFGITFFKYNLSDLLLLNKLAIKKFFIWQFFTSLLLVDMISIDFSSIIDLAIILLFLRLFCKDISPWIGDTKCLMLYAFFGIVPGIVAVFLMSIFHTNTYISECSLATLALATVWCMLPNGSFVAFSSKPKWLFLIALFFTVGSNLFKGLYINAASYIASVLVGYLYVICALGRHSPFDSLYDLEVSIKKIYFHMKAIWEWKIRTLFRRK